MVWQKNQRSIHSKMGHVKHTIHIVDQKKPAHICLMEDTEWSVLSFFFQKSKHPGFPLQLLLLSLISRSSHLLPSLL